MRVPVFALTSIIVASIQLSVLLPASCTAEDSCVYPEWKNTCQRKCLDHQQWNIQYNRCHSQNTRDLLCVCDNHDYTSEIIHQIRESRGRHLPSPPTIPEESSSSSSSSSSVTSPSWEHRASGSDEWQDKPGTSNIDNEVPMHPGETISAEELINRNSHSSRDGEKPRPAEEGWSQQPRDTPHKPRTTRPREPDHGRDHSGTKGSGAPHKERSPPTTATSPRRPSAPPPTPMSPWIAADPTAAVQPAPPHNSESSNVNASPLDDSSSAVQNVVPYLPSWIGSPVPITPVLSVNDQQMNGDGRRWPVGGADTDCSHGAFQCDGQRFGICDFGRLVWMACPFNTVCIPNMHVCNYVSGSVKVAASA